MQTQTFFDTEEKIEALEAISSSIHNCKKCPLHINRNNTVSGSGNINARLVLVGEAPGKEEDEQGKPFVGRSGKLLTEVLEELGVKRDDVYILNIIKCRPPENRTPTITEIASCINYLKQQIEIIEPQAIIALGSVATQNVLGKDNNIGSMRGRKFKYEKKITVVPTYHPSYILRGINNIIESENKTRRDVLKSDMKIAVDIVTKKSAGKKIEKSS